MNFPQPLIDEAFRTTNGEFGWTRAQALKIVAVLIDDNLAILGGELWWVSDAAGSISGVIPQENGVDAVYAWETRLQPQESWATFVRRCAAETVAAVNSLPRPGEVRSDLRGRILYNLTWVSEAEYDSLQKRHR